MIIFTSVTAREQYHISPHEVLSPYGPMIAYEQPTGKLYAPTGAGRGPDKWRLLGSASGRAFAGVNTLKRNEHIVAREDVVQDDNRIVVDDVKIDIAGQLVIGQNAQVTFRIGGGGGFIPAEDDVVQYGDRTIGADAELTVDGELTHQPDYMAGNQPRTRSTYTTSMIEIVDFDFVMRAEGQVPIVDGEIILNGEII